MKSAILILLCFLTFLQYLVSQNVAINATASNGHPSAGLDVNFTNKGMLIPRISLNSVTDTTTILSPANSLIVYNTNPSISNGNGVGLYFYCDSGCTFKGWKAISFFDNSSSNAFEWKYHSRLAFVNSSAEMNFAGLSPHNKWKVVIDVHNSTLGMGVALQMRINNLASLSYGTRFDIGSNMSTFFGTYWPLFNGSSGSNYTMISGDVVITDRYIAGVDSKTFTASLGFNLLNAPSFNRSTAITGYLSNELNQIQSINISSQLGPITGVIELWYKDYQ